MKVAIQLSSSKLSNVRSNRYLSYIDDFWYETSNEPVYLFDSNDIDKITEQMQTKYLYYCTILFDDGTEKEWTAFKFNNKKEVVESEVSGFYVTLKL